MIAKRTLLKRIPIWLGVEDIVFLSGSTATEAKVLVRQLRGDKSDLLFCDDTEFGDVYRIHRDKAVEHFDLFETGMAHRLERMSWMQLIEEEIDSYAIALTSVATKEALARCKMMRELAERKKITIQNKRAQEDLIHASDVKATYARFCGEVCRVIDEVAEVLPSKLEGMSHDDIAVTCADFAKKIKHRLRSVEL